MGDFRTGQVVRSVPTKKDACWRLQVGRDCRSNRMWRTMSKVMDRDKCGSTEQLLLTANGFTQFFSKKVADIRAATNGQPTPSVGSTASSSFTAFRQVGADVIYRVIMASPSESCPLDPIPTFLLKEAIDILLPYMSLLRSMRLCHKADCQFPRNRSLSVHC